MDFSYLLHGFFKIDTWFSMPWAGCAVSNVFFTDSMLSRYIVYCVQGMKLPSGGEEGIGRKGKVS